MTHQIWFSEDGVGAGVVVGNYISSHEEDDDCLGRVGEFGGVVYLSADYALQVGAFAVPTAAVGCPYLLMFSAYAFSRQDGYQD